MAVAIVVAVMEANMSKFKTWWHNTDSIEIVLFASLAFCVGWGLYHVVIGLVERFFG